MDPETGAQPSPPPEDLEDDDVEGHAFKWQVVEDPKSGGKRLRADWTPDEPQRAPTPTRKDPRAR